MFNICDGSGLIINKDGDRFCKCFRYQIAKREFKNTGASESYLKFGFELKDADLISKRTNSIVSMKETIKQLRNPILLFEAINNNLRILIAGKNGRGKTQMAVSMMLEALKRGCKGAFIDMRTFDNIKFQDKQKQDLMELVKNKQVLILDDLGVERKAVDEFQVYKNNLLDGLVRCHRGLIIITTNLSKNELEMLYKNDPQLHSALFTKSWVSYSLMGEDRRQETPEIVNCFL
jgi:DNA replication protein DnaC